ILTAMAIQRDGKILTAGLVLDAAGKKIRLARYLKNGSLDRSFNRTGTVVTDVGQDGLSSFSVAVALQKDGRILVANGRRAGGHSDFLLARYLKNGHLDTSFGTGGLAITDLGGDDAAVAVAVQQDGKIAAAGNTF